MISSVEILLIEDNPSDAELITDALKSKNLVNRVKILEDGAQVLDYFFRRGKFSKRKSLPKLILLDLKLPKVNGLEVLKEIKSNKKTRKIPVVVLTSSKEDSDIKEAYKLGANSYILKPVDYNQFTKAVGEIGLYWLLLNESQ